MRRAAPLYAGAAYMDHVHDDWTDVVGRASDALRRVKFDTMVGRGLSGALLIPRLAAEFDCYWMIVRKPADEAHTWRKVEGNLGARWIFVDDLIDSGATLKAAHDAITAAAESADHKTTFVGAYLYNDYGSLKRGFYGPRAARVQKALSRVAP